MMKKISEIGLSAYFKIISHADTLFIAEYGDFVNALTFLFS